MRPPSPLFLLVLAPALAAQNDGPPGLVRVPGGRTVIGSTTEEVQHLLEVDPDARPARRALDAERPQFERDVATFHLGLTEVTNGQYLPFVEQTGHRPPISWAAAAIEEARLDFLVAQADQIRAAQAEGRRPERKAFDPYSWWDENWRDEYWEMPAPDALKPVTDVDYQDALDWCRWAGLRLPTEFEFQRACRGDTRSPFPWGADWVDGQYAATARTLDFVGKEEVGRYEDGRSPQGIHDLAGNVWEWTSSPYVPYPGFEPGEYVVGRGRLRETYRPTPTWDADRRVVVSGSFNNTRLAARATTRRPADRSKRTEALGFRAAATPRVGVDVAHATLAAVVRSTPVRTRGATFVPDRVVALERWESRVEAVWAAPEGYSVITRYDHLAFVPVERLEDSHDASFRRDSLDAPRVLGFLSTSRDLVSPRLRAGVYVVAFRARGEATPIEDLDSREAADLVIYDPRIDPKRDNLLFLDAETGELARAIEAEGTAFRKGSGGGGFTRIDDVEAGQRRWRLEFEVTTPLRNRVFPLSITFRHAPGLEWAEWRR